MGYVQVQRARNTGANLSTQTGAAGEFVADTDDWTIIVRDGATAGGAVKLNPGSLVPQGRLSLSSNVPVETADIGPGTSVYYVPYVGKYVPMWDGYYWRTVPLSGQLTLALDNNSGHTGYQQANKAFDLFVFNNGGVVSLATGPAWTNNTTRSAGISQKDGIWVNTGSMVLKYDASSSTATAPASTATYVGTMWASAAGQCLFQMRKTPAAGGSAPVLGLWNAYNRVRYTSRSLDSNASWSYTTATWRQSDNNGSNQVSWIDGLGQSTVEATFSCDASGTVSIAVGLNSTTPEAHTPSTASASRVTLTARDGINPQMGFNTALGLELGGASGTFYGNGGQQLTISLEM